MSRPSDDPSSATKPSFIFLSSLAFCVAIVLVFDWSAASVAERIVGGIGLVFFGGAALAVATLLLPDRLRRGLAAMARAPFSLWSARRDARRRAQREAEQALYRNAPLAPELEEAVRNKRLRALRVALASGAEVNARDERGWTPLMTAADLGWVPGARALLGAGADPRPRDDQGRSAENLDPIYDESQHPYGGAVTRLIRQLTAKES